MESKTVGSSELTVGQLTELCNICQTNEAGQHFTEFCSDLDLWESLGFITIDKPVHHPSGIEYDSQYWTVNITDDGLEAIEAYSECI